MPRAGLTRAAVVDAALAVVDEQGMEALTLTAVAARTGVAVPSLYKHVGGLGELRVRVGVRVFEETAERMAAVAIGRSRDDAVAALMHAYRGYVLDHPARYAAMVADPLHDPAYAAAGTKLLDVFLAVLRHYGLDGADAVHAVRRLRAVVHGFVSIEAAGGFGLAEDTDVTYGQLVDMYLASLPRD
ncbi:TetR/AcrR family transcriptional regulator [Jiangella sp. DSM 45060]|uniref:TetR/AcrR family transcriptional regulator n=1 Tax=Jiangella sp. DSM 45060 TaxID=1798224 RepID=UPI00087A7F2E|nr:TetR-like C-terminal domain-containing protein [Jiangella sp. DSM 45060]SDT70183.1 DNA-binding transcriptional regulator, AcrR family [Jiangella sp. DSM 45060]